MPMTLIAGFKCGDGYVICADSQEVVREADGSESRKTCQKLVPIHIGKVTVSLAGAGDADLIDAFVERLRVNYQSSEITSLDACSTVIKDELYAFSKEKGIKRSRVGDRFRFMIGAYSPEERGCRLWRTAAGEPIEVQQYALVGYEDTRYDYAVRNFYRPGMPISQGVFLGLYVMWLGEHTSTYIHAPITVAILRDNGIQFEPQGKIDSIDQKVRLFTAQFESQFLACSDTGLQGEEFAARLKAFGATVIQFRREFIEEWVGQSIDTGLDRVVESWNSIPAGTTIVTVPITPPIDQALREMNERIAAELRNTAAHTQDADRIVANLKVLRDSLQTELNERKGIAAPPNIETNERQGEALTELMQAAMMGAYRVAPDIHALIARVVNAMPVPPEEFRNQRLRDASIALRVAVIDQTLAILEVPGESHPVRQSEVVT
jgi:20S proteasome alpha/beta subunit